MNGRLSGETAAGRRRGSVDSGRRVACSEPPRDPASSRCLVPVTRSLSVTPERRLGARPAGGTTRHLRVLPEAWSARPALARRRHTCLRDLESRHTRPGCGSRPQTSISSLCGCNEVRGAQRGGGRILARMTRVLTNGRRDTEGRMTTDVGIRVTHLPTKACRGLLAATGSWDYCVTINSKTHRAK